MGRMLERSLRRSGHERGRLRASDVALALGLLAVAALIIANLGAIGRKLSWVGQYMQLKSIRRGLIVGTLVSLCASLLGVSLVLKRFSMIGDGLSHVGFGALTVAVALRGVRAASLPAFLSEGARQAVADLCQSISGEPLPFALIVVTLCAFLLLSAGRGRMGGDSAIAMVSTCALAVGSIVIVASGMNRDVSNYMFGSITATSRLDLAVSVPLSAVVLIVFILFYPRIFAVTFDETFARATGTKVGGYNLLLALLTAVTVVIGMRLMGTMLISCLIIFPAVTSMRVFSHFRSVTVSAAVVSVTCFGLGMVLSMMFDRIPSGACIVAVNLLAFMIFTAVGRLRERFGSHSVAKSLKAAK